MNKKFKYIIFLLLSFVVVGTYYYSRPTKNDTELNQLITSNSDITDNMVRLLGWTGIRIKDDPLPIDPRWPEAKLILTSRNLDEVAQALNGDLSDQISWKQKQKKEGTISPPERWEMSGEYAPEQIKNIVDLYFIEMRLGEDFPIKTQSYAGVIFLGAVLPRARLRLSRLNKFIEEHSYQGPIYILTGERTLSEGAEENDASLLNPGEFPVVSIHKEWVAPEILPQTEYDMVKMVFDQSKHPSIKEHHLIRILASKREGETRASREGTVSKWIEVADPKTGTYLVIANQPYNLNQMLVVKRVLLEKGLHDIRLVVAGSRVSEKEVNDFRTADKVAVLLDNLNRIFHELKKIKAYEKVYGKSLSQLVNE